MAHVETVNHPGLDRLLVQEEASYPQRCCWFTISRLEQIFAADLRLNRSTPDCPGRSIEGKGVDGHSASSTATHSLQSSTSRRRGTSPALLYLLQACLQRDRSATRSGVKAWKSSPRSILSFSVESDIVLGINPEKEFVGSLDSSSRGATETTVALRPTESNTRQFSCLIH